MHDTLETSGELNGGCHCGHVRYQATGDPFHATSCHCSICRRVSGAEFLTWFSIRRAEFGWTQGRPASLASSSRGSHTFCPLCSSPLTFQHANYPDEIDIALSSLDDPAQLAPSEHSYISTRLAWVQLADGFPEFPRVRGH
jgi:hypothetical protein